MINHFRTWLLNRSPGFLAESNRPIWIEPTFRPAPKESFTDPFDTILFGQSPTATDLDEQFFRFLRLIEACQLRSHVRRFDPRETYVRDEPSPGRLYSTEPARKIESVITATLELPITTFQQLFAFVRDIGPEYEQGFFRITDTLTKFCTILFAQAIAHEKLSEYHHLRAKRIHEENGIVAPDSPGSFYFGPHKSSLIRMTEIKRSLQVRSGIRNRNQTMLIPIPELAWLYLAWPVRFGQPAHNRILVDGMLNSAWFVESVSDGSDEYLLFRSEHQIRSDRPIRVEVI